MIRDDHRGDRGVTSAISYTLTVVMAVILVTGLVIAASGHVNDQRSRTVRAQMDVVAQQVAGSIEAGDRLARSTDASPSDLVLHRTLPEKVLGSTYTVEVTADSVVVRSPISDRSVTTDHESTTEVVPSTVKGGSIVVRYGDYDGDPDSELEVADA